MFKIKKEAETYPSTKILCVQRPKKLAVKNMKNELLEKSIKIIKN